MLRALNLLFSPEAEWQKTALKPPHFATVLFISILPLMAAALAVEGYSLVKYGEMFRGLAQRAVSFERAVKYEVFYGAASLLAMFFGARLLRNVGKTFNLAASYSICFILIAFGYFPILLVRLMDAFPQINTWICWAVGAALSFRILYHGIALWLRPEQTKGFGLLLVSFVYILVISGVIHFAAIQVLQGRFLKDIYEPKGNSTPTVARVGSSDE
jgi:uncharacterized membrane protein YecN with MAPEG domain